MKSFHILTLVLLGGLNSIFAANDAPREKLLMDFGWQFHLGDAPDAGTQFDYPEFARLDKNRPDDDKQEAINAPLRVDAAAVHLGKNVSFVQPTFDASNWRQLNLPHDWAVELPFDRHAPTRTTDSNPSAPISSPTASAGIAARFELPASEKAAATWLEFDGVYRDCSRCLNGVCLGRNVSGYGSFHYDISRVANFGGTNTARRARGREPQFEGWFYEGAGIYRHVWLEKTARSHIARWGIFVTSECQRTCRRGNSLPKPLCAMIRICRLTQK